MNILILLREMNANHNYHEIIDSETAEDLISSFDEHYDILQISLNKLMHNADDKELINNTFRSIHTIKGNAGMVQIDPIVAYAHAVEETIGAMRSGYFTATHLLCEFLLTAIDRLRDLHKKYIFNKETTPIDEEAIASTFIKIANSKGPKEIESLCGRLSELFTPEQIAAPSDIKPAINLQLETIGQHADYLSLTEQQAEDLIFFRILSLQVDEQNNFWDKRTDLLLYLALKTATLSDNEIDHAQLTAAVYMHDAGMAFVSDSIVNKNARLNTLETKKLQQHPIWSYNLLKRMNGWEEASTMVLQHHERIDGEGYPNKVNEKDISEGAKLLSILDAYYAMTHLRADRSHRRSILRAISEINACADTQFCNHWVNLFNQVVREEVKAGVF